MGAVFIGFLLFGNVYSVRRVVTPFKTYQKAATQNAAMVELPNGSFPVFTEAKDMYALAKGNTVNMIQEFNSYGAVVKTTYEVEN